MGSSGSCKISMLLTSAQVKKYHSAKTGKVVCLPFQHKHLLENMKPSGFLPLFAAALAPVIGGVAGGLIDETIAGSGIFHKKHGKKLYEIGMVDVFGKSVA